MISISDIASEAFAAVAAEISDVVKTAEISHTVQGEYDPVTGEFATTTATYTGQAVFETAAALKRAFPDYVAGPADRLVILHGFSVAPRPGWLLTVDVGEFTIKSVDSVAETNELFMAIVA